MRKLALGFALTITVLTAGCEEEQVLYRVPSSEPIPAAPNQPTSLGAAGDPVPLGPVMAPGVAMGEDGQLPAPAAATFAPRRTRPVVDTPLVGLRIAVPSEFIAEKSTSSMRVAQYRIPNPAGGEPGELVAFYFGPGQGGDVAGNAGRWVSQFQPTHPDVPVLRRYETADVGTLRVSRITLEGTWVQSMMPGTASAPGPKSDWGMDALIVEGGPEGNLFLRLTGPASLVTMLTQDVEHMAATVAIAGGPAPEAAEAQSVPSAPPASVPGDSVVHVLHGVSVALPGDWATSEGSNSMRSLQGTMPGGSAGDGEFVVFHFGPGGGGGTRANLDRWASQVTGGPPAEQSTRTVDALSLSVITATGTYSSTAMGPAAPRSQPKADHRLVGVVVEGGPEGPLYFRFTGPTATMESLAPTIEAVLGSFALDAKAGE